MNSLIFRQTAKMLIFSLNVFIYIFLANLESYCQVYLPASPTVSELGNFGKIPVGKYTGSAQISIPIFELTCNELSLPISLSYSSGGIKVDQIASWTGLGWSLNAGGIIQCNIVAGSDLTEFEGQNVIIINLENGQPIGEIPDNLNNLLGEVEPDIFSYNFCGYQGQFLIDKDKKIMFLKSDNKLKVEITSIPWNYPDHEFTTFTITDNEGIQYKFEENEYSISETIPYSYLMELDDLNNNNGAGLLEDYRSIENVFGQTAWFLTKIIAPNANDSIVFEYENEIEENTSGLQGTLSYWENDIYNNTWFDEKWYGDCEFYWTPCEPEANYLPQSPGCGSFSRIKTINYTKKLSGIVASNGSIVKLFRNTIREDVENSINNSNRRLDEIILYNYTGIVKQWKFMYEYFQSDLTNLQLPYLNKRLKLKSIEQIGNINVPAENFQHSFSYYGDESFEKRMPYRNCYTGKDIFGYCNNQVSVVDALNVKKIFPNFINNCIPIADASIRPLVLAQVPPNQLIYQMEDIIWDYNENITRYTFQDGSNQAANLEYAKAYTLKQITYPTGGFSIFDYELHDYSAISNGLADECHQNFQSIGGLRIKNILHYYDDKSYMEQTFNYNNSGVLFDFPVFAYNKRIEVHNASLQCTAILNLTKLNSQPLNSLYSLTGEFIGYSTVTETIKDHGKVIYNYYNGIDFPNNFETYLLGVAYSSDIIFSVPVSSMFYPFYKGLTYPEYSRGLIKDIEYQNQNETTVKREKYNYNFQPTENVFGNQVHSNNLDHRISVYHYKTGYSQLTSKETVLLNENGLQIAQNIDSYTYNSSNLVEESKFTNSNGDEIIDRYIYPAGIQLFPTCVNTYNQCKEIAFKEKIERDYNCMGYSTCLINSNLQYVSDTISCSEDYQDCLSQTELNNDALVLHLMKEKNLLSKIIEAKRMVEINNQRRLISGEISKYRINGQGQVLLDKKLALFIDNPLVNYLDVGIDDNSNLLYNSNYRETYNFDIYDNNSRLLQLHDIANKYYTYTWNNASKVSSEVVNSKKNECGYASFEDHSDNDWRQQSEWIHEWGTNNSKTGNYSALVPRNSRGPNKYFEVGVTFNNYSGVHASTWVKGDETAYLSIQINDQESLTFKSSNLNGNTSEWKLLKIEVPRSVYNHLINNNLKFRVSTGTNSSEAYFDDIRFHPSDAQMTTYTYEPLIGVTSISNENNQPTYYIYDTSGRLEYIKDFEGNILKKNDYHYRTNGQ